MIGKPLRTRTSWGVSLSPAEAALLDAKLSAAMARAQDRASKRRVRCGAKTRAGTPCKCLSEPGRLRFKFHGGLSTGAKTPEGKERIREAQIRRWAKWRDARGG